MAERRGVRTTAALVVLTLTTGVIDAVSYLALGHVFTAVMTGNILLLGFAVAGGAGLSATASAVSLAGFVVGGLAGSRLEQRLVRQRHRWFETGMCVEGALLGAAGLAAWRLPAGPEQMSGRHYAVIAVVAAAMGVRNVTTLRAAVPALTTTVATRTLTALLDSLPAHPAGAGKRSVTPQVRRAAAVVTLFAGAAAGAAMVQAQWRPAVPLLMVAGVVLATAAVHARAARRAGRDHPAAA